MIRSLSHSGGGGGVSSPMLPSGAETPPSSLHGHPASSASLPAQGLIKLSSLSRRLPGALGGGPRSSWRIIALLLLLGAGLGRVLPPVASEFRSLSWPTSGSRLYTTPCPTKSSLRADHSIFSVKLCPCSGHLLSDRRPPPFHVPSSDFLPPPLGLARPSYHPPPPVEPAPGQAPNVVHYVFGYKPSRAGEPEGELLPYYTYLAIRSALVNLKPDAIYLCVLFRLTW